MASYRSLLFLTLLSGAIAHTQDNTCLELPGGEPTAESSATIDANNIRILNWNVRKNSGSGWIDDLQRLSTGADLVMLQEAVPATELQERLAESYHGVFAPGYKTGSYRSGVYTASRVAPLDHCALSHDEPWLGTPKATSISLYPLSEGRLQLLVVNLHGVNFTFNSTALARQLTDASAVIQRHNGPVIFSGDFNTWSAERTGALASIMYKLALQPLTFAVDQRTRFFGYPLDHVYVRGLRVLDSGTVRVASSDHNPVYATLAVQP